MVLVKAGKPVADGWAHLDDADPLPQAGAVTVSWTRWLAERETIGRAPAALGVRVANTVAPADIGPDADRFGLIAVTFPGFTDGRAFSQARVLRGRYCFRGEIRATGNVLRDQLQFMQRCGIDAFEVPERALAEDWFAALGEFDLFYQPAEDNRPWIARQRLGTYLTRMMVPLALDLALLPVALAGTGFRLIKRLELLDGEQVPGITVYAPDPDAIVAEAAGKRLVPRLPRAAEIATCRVLFVAGLPLSQSGELAAAARHQRVLVNVEDMPALCDFHVPAILRRGDLAISISTTGTSPTLSRRLRGYFGELLPAEWSERIRRIAALRQDMRAKGAGMTDIAKATDDLIDGEGWLPPSG